MSQSPCSKLETPRIKCLRTPFKSRNNTVWPQQMLLACFFLFLCSLKYVVFSMVESFAGGALLWLLNELNELEGVLKVHT